MGAESLKPASILTGAVFLSYASQDADAARQICDALRAAGIEVWFDQSELRGGDAWDQSIRRQIKTCALFLAIISKHTHERAEGYFRLEWKLAVDRSHLIMANKAFLVPVVIDDTADDEENVPDKFREVQWTRLPAGQTSAEFVTHIQQLLSGKSPQSNTLVRGAAAAASGTSSTAPGRRLLPYPTFVIAALALAALAIGLYAAWHAHSAAGMKAVRVEAPPPSALPAHTVAVLPFENLSAEPSDGFLATGIAESVLHRLASVKSLSVIARTSSFTFRGRDVDARDIGRQLNARYLVEGSVQRAGDRLRVTAQLLDASSGSDVWSLRLERRMGDIFELQDEISGKVTDAIGVSLAAEPGKTSSQRTPKLDAYLAYMEGRSLLATFNITDAEAGIERFRRATSIDPGFAAAYAEEAHALRVLWWMLHTGAPTAPEIERQASALVDKALSLDPELGEAWVERAFGRWQQQSVDTTFDATIDADFRKGLALAPNYAQGYENYGEWLDGIGRTDDALAMLERARLLDPLAPRNHYVKGLILGDRGEEDQAVELFLQALRVNPKYYPALTQLGGMEYARGNFAEAAKFLERAVALDPRAEWVRSTAVMVYLSLGDVAAAQDVYREGSPGAKSLCVLSYMGQEPRAAAQLYALPRADLEARVLGPAHSCASAVIRDDALKRGDYGRALHTLEVCLTEDWDPILGSSSGYGRTICAVRYASILMAAGERDRAARLLHAMLTAMQRHKDYTSEGGARARGDALALLGDKDAALQALEVAYAAAKWAWWYDIEHGPELHGLRADPRFQALAKQVSDNAAKQAGLLATMRRAGDIPQRPASQDTAER